MLRLLSDYENDTALKYAFFFRWSYARAKQCLLDNVKIYKNVLYSILVMPSAIRFSLIFLFVNIWTHNSPASNISGFIA